MTRKMMNIQAAVLSATLLLPAGSAFAVTHSTRHHRHHYSQTRGALVGAAAGAIVDHRHPLTGALIGAGVGTAVQYGRNKKAH
jgi:hypothetical protein